MRHTIFIVAIIFSAFSGNYLWKKSKVNVDVDEEGRLHRTDYPHGKPANPVCARIVSLAPSITESLFALGLDDNLVGVTRYCDYPPAALTKEKVGGYYDANYETIVSLKASLVVMSPEHQRTQEELSNINIETLVVKNNSILDILNTIHQIGKRCGLEGRASQMTRDLQARIDQIRQKTKDLDRPRVLVSTGRNMGTGSIKNAYITGAEGFYNEMLGLAGGVNAYQGKIAFPLISREGIIRLNPDVIFDMVPDLEKKGWDEAQILKEWKMAKELRAVREGRVHIFTKDYVIIPGPRFILLLEQMAKALHPEAFGSGGNGV